MHISQKSVPLQRVFHSIRFKVNKGWSTAVLLFLCPYVWTLRFCLWFHACYSPKEFAGMVFIAFNAYRSIRCKINNLQAARLLILQAEDY
ncbi:hypothetical protein B5F71_03335 [Bacteroides sp. An269]|nr:hypothetical protein B5F71_03335 [Bacteroides sp. An269]OUP33431.1 hypothetical protein B5F25_07505 [Bacteroides sp. An19]